MPNWISQMARNDPLRRYLRVQRQTDAEIKRNLERAALDARAQIRQLPEGVRKAQLQRALAAVTRAQADLWEHGITDAIVRGRSDAIAAAQTAADALTHELYARLPERSAGAVERGIRAAASEGMETEQARVPRELSRRVTGNRKLDQRRIEKIIKSGLTRGLNSQELARELYRHISPTVPGGASYAAMRIARTEINNAFHNRQIENGRRPGVEAIEWNLSGSHKVPDECNIFDGKNYQPDDVPDKPHPHCFCYLTYKMADVDDLLAQIANGDLDSLLFESEVMALEDDPATANRKINHGAHNHPATPAARGRCRAHGGTTEHGWPSFEGTGPALVAQPDPPETAPLVVGRPAADRTDDWLNPNLHPDVARAAERAYDASNRLVPRNASFRIRTVGTYDRRITPAHFHSTMDGGAYAACSGGHIVVQRELHNHRARIRNAQDEGRFIRHRQQPNEVESTLAHEMGHALTQNHMDSAETNRVLGALFKTMGWGTLPAPIGNVTGGQDAKWKFMFQNLGAREYNAFKRKFGEYAATNFDEFMAEIWAVYSLDPVDCDPAVRAIAEVMVEIIDYDPALLIKETMERLAAEREARKA